MPVVVITDGLLRRLASRELVAVLAHELAHIAKGDPAAGRDAPPDQVAASAQDRRLTESATRSCGLHLKGGI